MDARAGPERMGQEEARREARRRFLVLAGSAAFALGASRVEPATSLAQRIRDRWLFGRLSNRRPLVDPMLLAWNPAEDDDTRVGWDETGPVLSLNETAYHLLVRCRGEMTVREMAYDLCRAHEITIDDARKDVAETIRAFHRLKLVSL